MDIRKLKKLIELVEDSDIEELEIHEAQESVRIARRRAQPTFTYPAPVAAPSYPAPVTGTQPEPPVASVPDGHVIAAPMVGTFYIASSPGSKPFVGVGESVQVGDTLCIIEAMKILNQIEADVAGTVRAVLAEDAQPVEYGQSLFLLDPA